MQYPFSCMPNTFVALEITLSSQRLGRYLAEARGDKRRIMRLYVWNARLCEAFYLPCQLVEVAVRNRLHDTLTRRFSVVWYSDAAFVSPLPDRFKNEITNAVRDCTREHGKAMTTNHIVCSMSLGFWCHLLTSNFDHILWKNGMGQAFPHIARGVARQHIYDRLDQLRKWRNRIAHHGVIFDKKPMREVQNIKFIIDWVCPETSWLLNETSNVSRTINMKPKF